MKDDSVKRSEEGIIAREKTTGSDLNEVWKKLFSAHLEDFSRPVLTHAENHLEHGLELKIADIGGGSGIIGVYVKERLQERGYSPTLYVIDVNPAQLKAVPTKKDIVPVEMNIFDPGFGGYRGAFHIVTMRNVLHYIDRAKKTEALRLIYNSLNVGGALVLQVVAANDLNQDFKNNFMTGVETLVRGEQTDKYILTPDELKDQLQNIGFRDIFDQSLFKINYSINDFVKRFKLGSADVQTVCRFLLSANPKIKEDLNIRETETDITFDSEYFVVYARK